MAGKYSLLITSEPARRYANAAVVEAADTCSASTLVGTIAVCTAALVEAADTCSASAAVLVKANAALFDLDTMSGTSAVPAIANAAMFEAADTITASVIDIAAFRRRKIFSARYEAPRQQIARLVIGA